MSLARTLSAAIQIRLTITFSKPSGALYPLPPNFRTLPRSKRASGHDVYDTLHHHHYSSAYAFSLGFPAASLAIFTYFVQPRKRGHSLSAFWHFSGGVSSSICAFFYLACLPFFWLYALLHGSEHAQFLYIMQDFFILT